MRCEITLRPILPVHAEAVAALVALHLFGLSRDVLSLDSRGTRDEARALRSRPSVDLSGCRGCPWERALRPGARPTRSTACWTLRRCGTTRLAAGPPSRRAHPGSEPIRIRPWLTPFPRGCLPARARGLPPAGRPDTSFPRT